MVLPLSEEDTKRHAQLIREYSRIRVNNPDPKIEFIKNGVAKGVYRVGFGEESILAAAAARDVSKRLLPEYNILHTLYAGAPGFFPQPYAHYSSVDKGLGELILMECLDHMDIERFNQFKSEVPDYFRKLAYEIGKAVATVNFLTGKYSSEPHDGNILVKSRGDSVGVKFCDAAQFKIGDMSMAIEAILHDKDMRPECFRFIPHFRRGILDGMCESSALLPSELQPGLDKELRKYNPIF